MSISKEVDVLSIGAWSSENTKQMVRIGSNVLYQFKSHSDVCKQFFKIYQCYGCALEEFNRNQSFKINSKCRFFI